MKKVLILAYDFPPYISVGGQRPYSWYKYFHQFNLYPIVVTRQWDNQYGDKRDYVAPSKSKTAIVDKTETGTIIYAPYIPSLANTFLLKYGENKHALKRLLLAGFTEFAQWILFRGPKASIYIEAKRYMKLNHVDCIIATGDPFILFKYASKLSNSFNIPWIADYRDPWSNDAANTKWFAQKLWERYWEKKLLKHTLFITTICDFFKHYISMHVQNKNIYIIPNGYDPEIIDYTKEIKQNSNYLSIGITGSIYKWDPINSIIDTICQFLSTHPNAKIILNFHGVNIAQDIKTYITNTYPNYISKFIFHSKMKFSESIKTLATNNVFILFNTYSYSGTKIYEYVAIKRKVLLCFENEPIANDLKREHYHIQDINSISSKTQAEILDETQSGIFIHDAKHLYQVLIDLYSEFLTYKKIECNSERADKHSRHFHTQNLASIIHSSIATVLNH